MVLALRDKVPCIETDKFYRNPNRYVHIVISFSHRLLND